MGGLWFSIPPPRVSEIWGFWAPMTGEPGKIPKTPLYTIQPIMADLIFMSRIFELVI